MDAAVVAEAADLLARPFLIAALTLAVGCALLWIAPARRTGKYLTTVGVVLLFLLGIGAPFSLVGHRFEMQYPPLLDTTPQTAVKWVLVLGGGHYAGAHLPLSSRISSISLHRIAEGIRLYREFPQSRLIFSGAAIVDGVSIAELSRDLAVELGVEPQRIVVRATPRNTAEEARCAHELVRDDAFILVTSAVHMPRALRIFADQGMHPIPAPTGHRMSQSPSPGWSGIVPSTKGLADSRVVLHELLGMVWVQIGGAKRAAERYDQRACAEASK